MNVGNAMTGKRLLFSCVLAIVGAFAGQQAGAASTERVSVGSAGEQGDNVSYADAISPDGRFVAFRSGANNLVPNDTNHRTDIFVRDRLIGITERVSVSSAEEQANGGSGNAAISADGRFVAFDSSASNLVPNDTNSATDVFVRDRQTGTTERSSVSSAGGQTPYQTSSSTPSINADGRFVAFYSAANNLVPGDTAHGDIFVRDRLLGRTERVSVTIDGRRGNADAGYLPSISADGRFVAFGSLSDTLVHGDHGRRDAFVRDRLTGRTERVSGGNADTSDYTAVSADGRYVAFSSFASNLVPNDTNEQLDVFVRDRRTGTTERVSVSSLEAQGNSMSGPNQVFGPGLAISANGRFVFFPSRASNLVPNDNNRSPDSFLRDRTRGTTERLSVSSTGEQGTDGGIYSGDISADGRFAAFNSHAPNLVPDDTNNHGDAFVRDRGPQQLPPTDDLLVDFGATGLLQRINDTDWVKVHNSSPVAIATGDLDGSFRDEAIATFSGQGLFARYNNFDPWVKLHDAAPARLLTGDFDASGLADIAISYDTLNYGTGIFIRYNNADPWRQVHTIPAQALAVGDLDGDGKDELLADLGADGLQARFNDRPNWTPLFLSSPDRIATADLDGNGLDEAIGDFVQGGIFARYNNAGGWVPLHNTGSQGIAAGDLDGDGKDELVADFGAQGILARYNDADPWQQIDPRNPLRMLVADLDRTGGEELIANFGPSGLFARYNDAGSFVNLHPVREQAMAGGGF